MVENAASRRTQSHIGKHRNAPKAREQVARVNGGTFEFAARPGGVQKKEHKNFASQNILNAFCKQFLLFL